MRQRDISRTHIWLGITLVPELNVAPPEEQSLMKKSELHNHG